MRSGVYRRGTFVLSSDRAEGIFSCDIIIYWRIAIVAEAVVIHSFIHFEISIKDKRLRFL